MSDHKCRTCSERITESDPRVECEKCEYLICKDCSDSACKDENKIFCDDCSWKCHICKDKHTPSSIDICDECNDSFCSNCKFENCKCHCLKCPKCECGKKDVCPYDCDECEMCRKCCKRFLNKVGHHDRYRECLLCKNVFEHYVCGNDFCKKHSFPKSTGPESTASSVYILLTRRQIKIGRCENGWANRKTAYINKEYILCLVHETPDHIDLEKYLLTKFTQFKLDDNIMSEWETELKVQIQDVIDEIGRWEHKREDTKR